MKDLNLQLFYSNNLDDFPEEVSTIFARSQRFSIEQSHDILVSFCADYILQMMLNAAAGYYKTSGDELLEKDQYIVLYDYRKPVGRDLSIRFLCCIENHFIEVTDIKLNPHNNPTNNLAVYEIHPILMEILRPLKILAII